MKTNTKIILGFVIIASLGVGFYLYRNRPVRMPDMKAELANKIIILINNQVNSVERAKNPQLTSKDYLLSQDYERLEYLVHTLSLGVNS